MNEFSDNDQPCEAEHGALLNAQTPEGAAYREQGLRNLEAALIRKTFASAQERAEALAQFYALAAKMMRDILVDHLRRRRAAKRGGSQIEIALDDANPAAQPHWVDFLILDDAMTRLGEIGPRYPRIVELRYLAGLTIEETAEVLNISHATVEREWSFARAWLRRDLQSRAARREESRDG